MSQSGPIEDGELSALSAAPVWALSGPCCALHSGLTSPDLVFLAHFDSPKTHNSWLPNVPKCLGCSSPFRTPITTEHGPTSKLPNHSRSPAMSAISSSTAMTAGSSCLLFGPSSTSTCPHDTRGTTASQKYTTHIPSYPSIHPCSFLQSTLTANTQNGRLGRGPGHKAEACLPCLRLVPRHEVQGEKEIAQRNPQG